MDFEITVTGHRFAEIRQTKEKRSSISQYCQHSASKILTLSSFGKLEMETCSKVLQVLDDVLSLSGRALQWNRETPLLGAVPELDSMAVVSLLTELTDRLGIDIDYDDFDGSIFTNVGTLVDYVQQRTTA